MIQIMFGSNNSLLNLERESLRKNGVMHAWRYAKMEPSRKNEQSGMTYHKLALVNHHSKKCGCALKTLKKERVIVYYQLCNGFARRID